MGVNWSLISVSLSHCSASFLSSCLLTVCLNPQSSPPPPALLPDWRPRGSLCYRRARLHNNQHPNMHVQARPSTRRSSSRHAHDESSLPLECCAFSMFDSDAVIGDLLVVTVHVLQKRSTNVRAHVPFCCSPRRNRIGLVRCSVGPFTQRCAAWLARALSQQWKWLAGPDFYVQIIRMFTLGEVVTH